MPLAQRFTAFLAVAVLATGALTVADTPRAAHAATDDPTSVLVLSVEPHVTGAPRTTVLRCGPAGGTHPNPAAACRTLASVNGDPAALELDRGLCTLEHAPVTARAWGLWQDRPVSYHETFGNRCATLRETGPIFDF